MKEDTWCFLLLYENKMDIFPNIQQTQIANTFFSALTQTQHCTQYRLCIRVSLFSHQLARLLCALRKFMMRIMHDIVQSPSMRAALGICVFALGVPAEHHLRGWTKTLNWPCYKYCLLIVQTSRWQTEWHMDRRRSMHVRVWKCAYQM